MAVIPLLSLILFVVALIDIILRTGDQIKHLPKLVWILIVILLPLIGSILWFALGREYGMRSARPARPWRPAHQGRTIVVPESGAVAAPVRGPGALSTEEQLAALEREIADDRIRRLEAELRSRRDGDADPA